MKYLGYEQIASINKPGFGKPESLCLGVYKQFGDIIRNVVRLSQIAAGKVSIYVEVRSNNIILDSMVWVAFTNWNTQQWNKIKWF